MKLSTVTRNANAKLHILAAALIAAITAFAGRVASMHADRLRTEVAKQYAEASKLDAKANELRTTAERLHSMAKDVDIAADDAYNVASEAFAAMHHEIRNLKGL